MDATLLPSVNTYLVSPENNIGQYGEHPIALWSVRLCSSGASGKTSDALHMIVGIGLLSVMAILTWLGKISVEHYNRIEVSGLYWHFVDIIWIYLFPLLYLITGNRH
jgi:Cytochrome c oxidase subunit III